MCKYTLLGSGFRRRKDQSEYYHHSFKILLVIFTWMTLGDCREFIDKLKPEIANDLNIFGLDVLYYVMIWIVITVIGTVLSVAAR